MRTVDAQRAFKKVTLHGLNRRLVSGIIVLNIEKVPLTQARYKRLVKGRITVMACPRLSVCVNACVWHRELMACRHNVNPGHRASYPVNSAFLQLLPYPRPHTSTPPSCERTQTTQKKNRHCKNRSSYRYELMKSFLNHRRHLAVSKHKVKLFHF